MASKAMAARCIVENMDALHGTLDLKGGPLLTKSCSSQWTCTW